MNLPVNFGLKHKFEQLTLMLEIVLVEMVWIGNEFTLNGNLKLQINCLQSQDPGHSKPASHFFHVPIRVLLWTQHYPHSN